MTPQHLWHDITYRDEVDTYHMVVENPAGSGEKWTLNVQSGQLEHEQQNGLPRIIRFLPYPFNYGFLPQTLAGDGDPLDVVLLAPTIQRGTCVSCAIIGALQLIQSGVKDTKLIAISLDSPFHGVETLNQLNQQWLGALAMVEHWFMHYKGIGAYENQGWLDRTQAHQVIEEAHQHWVQSRSA